MRPASNIAGSRKARAVNEPLSMVEAGVGHLSAKEGRETGAVVQGHP